MNVLILHPALARRSFLELTLVQEPIAHIALGTALRDRHRVRVLDLRITPRLGRELADFRPDAAVVGVGPSTHRSLDATLAELRRLYPGVRILLFPDAEYGNQHVVERPQDYRHPDADVLTTALFLRDLCAVVPRVIDAWERSAELTDIPGLWCRDRDGSWRASPPLEGQVGDYGVPDRALLGRARGKYVFAGITGTAFLFSTFGCKFGCRYCTMSKWSGTLYERDLDDVVRELAEMSEPNVFLSDFEPLQAPEHMARLADAIEAAGIQKHWFLMTRADSALEHEALLLRWKAIGLRWIYLGLDGESGARLAELRKGATPAVGERAVRRLEELGFAVVVGFVVSPHATRADFAGLRREVKRLRPPAVGFSVETPMVGTRLFDETEAQLTTRDWSLFDLHHAVLPTSLPLPAFYREMARLHVLSGRTSARTLLRNMRVRDNLRSAVVGTRRLLDVALAARDHRERAMRRA